MNPTNPEALIGRKITREEEILCDFVKWFQKHFKGFGGTGHNFTEHSNGMISSDIMVASQFLESWKTKYPADLIPEEADKAMAAAEFERYALSIYKPPHNKQGEERVIPLGQSMPFGFRKWFKAFKLGFDKGTEYHSLQSWADQKERVELKRKVEELEEVLEDKRKTAKEIDVIINGKNAAQQPALIDVQKSVELLVRELAAEKEKSVKLVEALTEATKRMERARNILKKEGANWGMLDTSDLTPFIKNHEQK
jgi:hypothetical protein